MVLRHVYMVPLAAFLLNSMAIAIGYISSSIQFGSFSILPSLTTSLAIPYICVYSQILNISSLFLLLTFYIRHRQCVEYYGHRLQWEGQNWRNSSLLSLSIGIISVIGLTVYSNFPESEVKYVYSISIYVTVGSLVLYVWSQTLIGYLMIPHMASQAVNLIRFCLLIIITYSIINHQLLSHFLIFSLTPEESIFYLCVLEWIFFVSLQIFLLSFISELRISYFHAPRVFFRRHSYQRLQESSTHVQIITTPAERNEHL